MDYRELKNFGEFYTGKASPTVMMRAMASLPKDMGFVGAPKILARLQKKERYWKKQRFKAAEERGFTNEEFIQSMRYGLAVHTALIEVLGDEKGMEATRTFGGRMGRMVFEEFLPTAEDFLRCPDPWDAVRRYFLEFFQVNEREGAMRFEVVQDTDRHFQVHVTDCAWEFIWGKAGYSELLVVRNHSECTVLSRMMDAMGSMFNRSSCLCTGDATCDWHFYRHKTIE